MSCKVFRNSDGIVESVIAPNGEESKLYSDILAHPDVQGDQELAVDMYLLAYTKSFKNYFGDFEIGQQKGLVDSNDEPFISSILNFLNAPEEKIQTTAVKKAAEAPKETNNYFQLNAENVMTNSAIIESISNKLTNFNTYFRRSDTDDLLKQKLLEQGLTQFEVDYLEALDRNSKKEKLNFSVLLANEYSKQLQDNLLETRLAKLKMMEANKELDNQLLDFLKPFGVTLKEIDNLKQQFGVDAFGVADIMNKVIYAVKNRKLDTIAEEVGHFYTELIGTRGADTIGTQLMNKIENWSGYNKVYASYKDVYLNAKKEPDVDKIKKEAIGQAIAEAIIKRYASNSESIPKSERDFWNMILDLIKKISDFFQKSPNFKPIEALTDDIAKKIFNKDYSDILDRIEKVKEKNKELKTYDETLKNIPSVKAIIDKIISMGGILGGSLALRAQGVLYRNIDEKIHDLDFSIEYDNWNGDWLSFVDRFKKEFPNYYMISQKPYSGNSGELVFNGVITNYPELYKKFISLSGDFNSRLENFTLDEQNKILLVDFFLQPEGYKTKQLKGLTSAGVIFNAKSNMGMRPKDVFDLINYTPYEKTDSQELSLYSYYQLKKSAETANKYAEDLKDYYNKGFAEKPDHRSWYIKDHLDVVQNIVDDLYTKYGGDKNILDLMVYTHDLAKAMNNETKSHRETIEPVLKKMGIANDVINTVISNVEMMDQVKTKQVNNLPIEVKILSTADALSHYTTGNRGFLNIFSNETSNADMNSIKESNKNKLAKDKRKILLSEFSLDDIKISYDGRTTSVSGSVTDYLNNLRVPVLAENVVDAGLKSVNALQSDKAIQLFNTLQKNRVTGDAFWNKLQQDLQIPKEQIELLKQYNTTDREELITNMLADYSFAIEINLAKESMSDSKLQELSRKKEFQKDNFKYFSDSEGYWRFDNTIDAKDRKLEKIDLSDYVKAYRESIEASSTQYYSNLTVPGGTNYTENELATPAITPSIKGHAQFATDKGIGWFRSDDKQDSVLQWGVYTPENELLASFKTEQEAKEFNNKRKDKDWNQVAYVDTNVKETKTRRILEVQSDYFQKLRNKFNYQGFKYEIINTGEGRRYKKIGEKGSNWTLTSKEYNEVFEDFIDKGGDNQFLALLHKGDNWVTFFVKSIIQDSAKKGYEKVVFPTGSTAYKIESGGNTIEDFIKNKEDRIKFLQDSKQALINSKKEKVELSKNSSVIGNINLGKTVEDFNNEIDQLKKEIEDVKRGTSGLAATAKFYQETVANVLKKQGYAPKQVTDEYGNTWNEVDVIPERDANKILFQMEAPTQVPVMQNIANVRKVLERLKEKFGVEYEIVNEPDAGWKGKFEKGKVYINAAKKITKDTAFHEYLHPFVDALRKDNPSLHAKLIRELQSIDEGIAEIESVKQAEGYQDLTEEEMLDEALVSYLGKLASGNITLTGDVVGSQVERVRQSMLTQFKNWLKRMFSKLFSIKISDLDLNYNLQDIADMVSMSDAKIDVTGLPVKARSNFQLSDETRSFKERLKRSANDLQKKIIDTVMFEAKQGEEDPGRIVLEEKSHTYIHTRTGQVYKSVTTAIKGVMNDPEGKYERNRLFGTEFDKVLQNIIEGNTFEQAKSKMTGILSEEISRRAYDALQGYIIGLTADGSIVIPQAVFGDPVSGIAGSLDLLIVKPNGSMMIVDLKVSKNSFKAEGYRSNEYSLNEGSELTGTLTTQQQHAIQVAIYKRLAEINGLSIDLGTKTLHIKLELEGEGTTQQVKDFAWEGDQTHFFSSNESIVNRIVPTKPGKNKVAGFKKVLGIHNPANDEDFLDEDEAMPEEDIPGDVMDKLQFTIATYVDKLRKRMDYLENLNQTRFEAFSEESKEASIDKISKLLTRIEFKNIGKPQQSLTDLLNYTKDTLDSLYSYINDPANVSKEQYIDVILEAEKFVKSYENIANVPELGLGSESQYKLMRNVQSRLNAVLAEINPALENYVKELIKRKSTGSLNEEEITNLLREGFDISLDQMALSDMQNTKERLLAIAANLYMEANQKAMNRADEFISKVKAAGNKLARALGVKKIDFSFMLNYDQDGNFTGRYLEAIGQTYYTLKRKMYDLLKNDDGENMEYIEIENLKDATPDQLLHNIELQKRKEKLREFRQAETLDDKGQIVSGEYHRFSQEFINARAQYEIPNGQALAKGSLVWVPKIGVPDEAYRKFLNKYYDRKEYITLVKEKNGSYTGKTKKEIGYFPKKQYVEIKEISSSGQKMTDPRYDKLMNPTTEVERAQKEFYLVYISEMKDRLSKLPLDVQQQMLGKVARVKDNYLNSAKRKGSSTFKAIVKNVRSWFDISPKMHSLQRLTDDDGIPVDNLPILYTNSAREEKKIKAIEQKIKDLKNDYIINKKINTDVYEAELKKLNLSLAIENAKMDYNDINVDLVENLIAFGSMAEKYEQMANIESSLLAISKIVEKKKYYQSNSLAEKFVTKGKDKKEIYKPEGQSLAYTRLKKWFKMVYYNNDEYDYSTFAQVAEKLQNITSLKGMGLNIFGGINNYVMGRINNAIEAYGGVYYQRKAYFRATGEYNKDYMPGLMKKIGSDNEGPYKSDKPKSKYEALVNYFRMVRKFQADAGRVDMFSKAYIFQEAGEYNVQSKTGMAIVMSDKFELTHSQTGEKVAIYDAFNFDPNTGELELKPGFDINEDLKTKVTNYIYEVNKQIHGNYAWEDRMVIQQHALGDLAAQFHKWVYPLIRARFQKRYDNEVLGTIEGRYRTFWNVMKYVYQTEQGVLAKTAGILKATFAPGSVKGLDEIQVRNMYKNLAELGFLMASFVMAHLFTLLASGLDDDDEQLKRLMNFLTYQQTRQQNEIKTFIPVLGIKEQYQMAKSPIAALTTLRDWGEVATSILVMPFPPYDKNYYERGPHKGSLKFWKELKDVTPAFNILNRWESFETVRNFYIK